MIGCSAGSTSLPLAQFGSPGPLLFVEPLEPMVPHFGQADPVHGITPHLKGVAALLLFPLQPLLMPGVEGVESLFPLAFGFRPQPPEDRFDRTARLGSHLLDCGPFFQQAIPNMSGCGQQDAAVIVMKDRQDLHVAGRLVVECDAPQRPVTNDLGWQMRKAHAGNRLGNDDTGQLLYKPTNSGILQADVWQASILGVPAVEGHALHPVPSGHSRV